MQACYQQGLYIEGGQESFPSSNYKQTLGHNQ
jgi:hypothetical protein